MHTVVATTLDEEQGSATPHPSRTGEIVPESRTRKKRVYTPPPSAKTQKPSPPWYAPVMVALMVVGLVWVVVTYLSGAEFPIPGINQWNLAVGFVIIMAGFMMTTRWR
jgi:hypothetical protein